MKQEKSRKLGKQPKPWWAHGVPYRSW